MEGQPGMQAQEKTIWPALGRVLVAARNLIVTGLLPFAYLALRVWVEFMSWAIAIGLGLIFGMLAAILGVRMPRVVFVYRMGR